MTAHYWVKIAAIALTYFVLAKAGLKLASINPSASPVWPPTGFALAMVLLHGYRIWPAVLIAALFANATTAGTLPASAAIASGNALEALAGGYLIKKWCGGTQTFDTPASIAKFALAGTAPPTVISATIGVLALRLGGFVAPSQFGSVWITWWTGDYTSALLLTPVLVLWTVRGPWTIDRNELAATLLLIAATLAVGLIAFSPLITSGSSKAPTGFLAMIPLLWAALHRGPRDTATVGLILACFAVWGGAEAGGPSNVTVNESYMRVTVFVIGAALPSLVLSAEVALRRTAENRLRESEERFRGIFEHAATGIAIIDLEGQFASCNPAYSRMLGYSEGELRAAKSPDLVHPDDKDRNLAEIKRLAAQEMQSFELFHRYAAKGGRTIWVHKHASLLRDAAGLPSGIILLVTDMTERKQQEERQALAQQHQYDRQYLEWLRHEVRQPVAQITSSVELIQLQKAQNRDLQPYIDSALLGAQHVWNLIERASLATDAVAFVRQCRPQPLELRGLVEKVVTGYEQTHYGLKFKLKSPEPVALDADPTLITEAVRNMLSNAASFAAEGSTVEVEVIAGAGWARIVVSNEGPLLEGNIEALFGAFSSTRSSPDNEHHGIGLYLVRLIAQQHGGSATISNRKDGSGVEASLLLPIRI